MTVDHTVSRWLARWFMRFEAAGSILRILLFGGTFLSTGVSALHQYGLQSYAGPFILAVSAGTVVFAYIYAEHGVFNQKNRDTADVGDNYSGPTMLMDKRLEARQLAYLGYVLQNGSEKSIGEMEEELREITEEEWTALRDGVNIEEIKQ